LEQEWERITVVRLSDTEAFADHGGIRRQHFAERGNELSAPLR
jgi:hypothetical protein